MFEPGKSGNPNGRPPGKPNKSTIEFKEALNNLLKDCSPQIQGWIDQVAQEDPGKALGHLGRLAEYVYPKLARTEQQFLDKDGEPTDAGLTVRYVE